MEEKNKIVYRKKRKFLFKNIVSQEIVKKENKNKVYLIGKIFPINKKKIYENPEFLLRNKKDKTFKFRLFAIILIIVSCFAPIVFTRWSLYDLTDNDYSNIANTIYGLTGPFIAIAAAFLTYAAFLVQKRANDIQIESTNEQIRKNKIDSFENRLFKLIDTHRKNVDELKTKKNKTDEITGQKTISYMRINIYVINFLLNKSTKIDSIFNAREIQIFAYLIYVHGNSLISNKYFENEKFKKYSEQKECIKKICDLMNKMADFTLTEEDDNTAFLLQNKFKDNNDIRLQHIVNNRMDTLSRYFRQIFQIYKYIDKQDFLSDKEKYDYAKVFRTNLTNYEQEIIYNNILSPYGTPWFENNFIIKYKPFKNVAAYGMYGYSPADFFKDTYNILEKDLDKYLDVYSYNDEIKV